MTKRLSTVRKALAVSLALPITIAAVSLLLAACGDGDSKDKDAVEDTVRSAIAAYTDGDLEGFLTLFTDKGLSDVFLVPEEDVDAFKEELAQFIGEDPPVLRGFSDTQVSGDTATTVSDGESDGTLAKDRWTLTKDGDAWTINGYDGWAVSADIPDGYTTVSFPVQEFAFGLVPEQVTTGKVAFEVRNVGKQRHEAALVSLAEDLDLEVALQAALEIEGLPEGMELAGRIDIEPGEETNMVLLDELTAGRYAFICFFPDVNDPEQTPHAFKGMTSPFELE